MTEFTPIPETNVLPGGQITTDDANVREWDRQRELQEAAARERVSSRGKMDPKVTEEMYKTDVGVLDALFSSEFWSRDVMPRVMDYWGAATDKEFWTEDFAGHAPAVLKTAGKSSATSIAGAPMDLTTIGAHTFWWAASNLGLSDKGIYDWVDDMPDFKKIPLTSDWIGKEILGEDPDTLAWVMGSLASPFDIAAVSKAAMFIGMPVGWGRYVKNIEKDAEFAKYVHGKRAEAVEAAKEVEAGRMTIGQMIEDTGFMVDADGNLKMFVDSRDATFHWDKLESKVLKDAADWDGDGTLQVEVRYGDILEHQQMNDIYGPAWQDQTVILSVEKIPEGKKFVGRGGVTIHSDDASYQLSAGAGTEYGAMMDSRFAAEDNIIQVSGVGTHTREGVPYFSEARARQLFEGVIIHENAHGIEAFEGWPPGGAPRYYQRIIDNNLESYRRSQAVIEVAEWMRQQGPNVQPLEVRQYAIEVMKKLHAGALGELQADLSNQVNKVTQKAHAYLQNNTAAQRVKTDRANAQRALEAQLNKYAGTKVEADAIDQFVKKIDSPQVYELALNMYYRLGGEMGARLSQYLWDTRKGIRPIGQRVDDAWNRVQLDPRPQPEMEKIFGSPDADFQKPIIEDFGVSSYLPGDPARAEYDKLRQGVAVVDEDGMTTGLDTPWQADNFAVKPQSDPLQPEGPVFDRGREKQRTMSTRGGTTGGLMDSSFEERPRPSPEGTQQTGTLEELFPPIDNSDEFKPQSVDLPPEQQGIISDPFEDDIALLAPKEDDWLNYVQDTNGELHIWAGDDAPEALFDPNDIADSGTMKRKDFEKNVYTKDDGLVRLERPTNDPKYEADLQRRIAENKVAMKDYTDGINDVYLTSRLHGSQGGKMRVELLKNPTETQFNKWAAKYFRGRLGGNDYEPDLRVLTDVEGNYYIWDAEMALHDDMIKATGMRPDLFSDWTDVDGIEVSDVFRQLRMDKLVKVRGG